MQTRALKFTKIAAGLAIAVLLLVALSMYVLHRQGYGIYSVRSDSMEPVLTKGSALILDKKDVGVVPGDVVSYASPLDPRKIITHRVTSVYPKQGVFLARGDNAPASDDPVPQRNLIGTAVFKIPLAGYGLEALRHPAGLAVILYLPAFGIIAEEIGRLKQHYANGPRCRYLLYGRGRRYA
jgi:signal peptidase I